MNDMNDYLIALKKEVEDELILNAEKRKVFLRYALKDELKRALLMNESTSLIAIDNNLTFAEKVLATTPMGKIKCYHPDLFYIMKEELKLKFSYEPLTNLSQLNISNYSLNDLNITLCQVDLNF